MSTYYLNFDILESLPDKLLGCVWIPPEDELAWWPEFIRQMEDAVLEMVEDLCCLAPPPATGLALPPAAGPESVPPPPDDDPEVPDPGLEDDEGAPGPELEQLAVPDEEIMVKHNLVRIPRLPHCYV